MTLDLEAIEARAKWTLEYGHGSFGADETLALISELRAARQERDEAQEQRDNNWRRLCEANDVADSLRQQLTVVEGLAEKWKRPGAQGSANLARLACIHDLEAALTP